MEWNNENSRENECNYKINKNFKSIIKILFPELKNEKEIRKEIAMNMIANIFRFRKCGYTTRDKGNEIYAKK